MVTASDIKEVINHAEELGAVSYQTLVAKRREVHNEVEAMRVIVSMASMNVDVLMADVLAKKKRVTTRLDSTPEGSRLLSEAVKCNAEGEVGLEVLRRLRAARRLTMVRNEIKNELASYQNGWNKFPVARAEHNEIIHRFILNKIQYLTATSLRLKADGTTGADTEAFVYEILVEELEELLLKSS